jgi:hypothetical protein
MRRLSIALFLLASLAGSHVPALAQGQPSLDQIVEMLVSDDVTVRREARLLLEAYLEGLDDTRQRDEIGKLCARLWQADYRQQLGLAVALSQLSTPWETNQQDHDIGKLYALMQNTKDETLGRYLDDALANAKGLYFDAINDYNNIDDRDPGGEIARMPRVRAKFQRMAGFENSIYAGNAVFYLGQYLARMATIFGKGDPALNQSLLDESSQVFDDYVGKAQKGIFRRATFTYDALFYRALNQVIAGQPDLAVKLLAQIPNTSDERIYVYQFFYSRDRDTVIDRTINGGPLVERTMRHISKFGNDSIDNQAALVRAIRNMKMGG